LCRVCRAAAAGSVVWIGTGRPGVGSNTS
jgi:hypothetical protein